MFEIERRFLLRSAAAAAALGLTPWRARAQTAADPSHLTGPDRTARLIAGAKKEGALTLYSSAPIEVMSDVTKAFTKKYGVKVDLWRGGSEQILQRVLTEARGRRIAAD